MAYFLLLEKMSNNLLRMFDVDADPSAIYDFDKIDLQKKKHFIEGLFEIQRSHMEHALDDYVQELFLSMLEKTYKEKRQKIVSDLNGGFNSHSFRLYFASFFTFEDICRHCSKYFLAIGEK